MCCATVTACTAIPRKWPGYWEQGFIIPHPIMRRCGMRVSVSNAGNVRKSVISVLFIKTKGEM